MLSRFLVLTLSALQLIAAHPTAKSKIQSRCGVNGLVPDNMYLLQEGQPDAVTQSSNGLFQISQSAGSAGATNRTYMLITFAPTPTGSYGCELNWKLDPTLQFVTEYGATQIDVEQTTGYVPPYKPTWNNIIAANPPVTLSASGTVNAVAGADATINTYVCSNVGSGYGLAFVYKFAQWVEQSGAAAAVSFYMGEEMETYTDTFIDYDC